MAPGTSRRSSPSSSKANPGSVTVHAAGHSAGSIFHSYLIPELLSAGVPEIASLNLLAPGDPGGRVQAADHEEVGLRQDQEADHVHDDGVLREGRHLHRDLQEVAALPDPRRPRGRVGGRDPRSAGVPEARPGARRAPRQGRIRREGRGDVVPDRGRGTADQQPLEDPRRVRQRRRDDEQPGAPGDRQRPADRRVRDPAREPGARRGRVAVALRGGRARLHRLATGSGAAVEREAGAVHRDRHVPVGGGPARRMRGGRAGMEAGAPARRASRSRSSRTATPPGRTSSRASRT